MRFSWKGFHLKFVGTTYKKDNRYLSSINPSMAFLRASSSSVLNRLSEMTTSMSALQFQKKSRDGKIFHKLVFYINCRAALISSKSQVFPSVVGSGSLGSWLQYSRLISSKADLKKFDFWCNFWTFFEKLTPRQWSFRSLFVHFQKWWYWPSSRGVPWKNKSKIYKDIRIFPPLEQRIG